MEKSSHNSPHCVLRSHSILPKSRRKGFQWPVFCFVPRAQSFQECLIFYLIECFSEENTASADMDNINELKKLKNYRRVQHTLKWWVYHVKELTPQFNFSVTRLVSCPLNKSASRMTMFWSVTGKIHLIRKLRRDCFLQIKE